MTEEDGRAGVPDATAHPLHVPVMGGDEVGAWLYVASGDSVVLLCEHGDAPRWRNAMGLTPDAARKLGNALIAMAWQADHPGEDEG